MNHFLKKREEGLVLMMARLSSGGSSTDTDIKTIRQQQHMQFLRMISERPLVIGYGLEKFVNGEKRAVIFQKSSKHLFRFRRSTRPWNQ